MAIPSVSMILAQRLGIFRGGREVVLATGDEPITLAQAAAVLRCSEDEICLAEDTVPDRDGVTHGKGRGK